MVADNQSGKSVMSEVRTSSGMFLNKRQVRSYSYMPCQRDLDLFFSLFSASSPHSPPHTKMKHNVVVWVLQNFKLQ
jgi:hypothetical protein